MGRENIKVFARIRPLIAQETEFPSWINVNNNVITGNENCDRIFSYKFNYVMEEETNQSELYSNCHSFVESALEGYNTTIFA